MKNQSAAVVAYGSVDPSSPRIARSMSLAVVAQLRCRALISPARRAAVVGGSALTISPSKPPFLCRRRCASSHVRYPLTCPNLISVLCSCSALSLSLSLSLFFEGKSYRKTDLIVLRGMTGIDVVSSRYTISKWQVRRTARKWWSTLAERKQQGLLSWHMQKQKSTQTAYTSWDHLNLGRNNNSNNSNKNIKTPFHRASACYCMHSAMLLREIRPSVRHTLVLYKRMHVSSNSCHKLV